MTVLTSWSAPSNIRILAASVEPSLESTSEILTWRPSRGRSNLISMVEKLSGYSGMMAPSLLIMSESSSTIDALNLKQPPVVLDHAIALPVPVSFTVIVTTYLSIRQGHFLLTDILLNNHISPIHTVALLPRLCLEEASVLLEDTKFALKPQHVKQHRFSLATKLRKLPGFPSKI